MTKQVFEADVPKGMRLGFAEGPEGGVRGLLFDEKTNTLRGQARFFPVDDDDLSSNSYYDSPDAPPQRDEEYEEFVRVVAAALALVVIHAVGAAAPHVRQWWQDKAAPAVKSTRTKLKSKLTRTPKPKKNKGVVVPDVATLVDTEAPSASNKADAGVDAVRPTMSSAEARQLFGEAVAAMAFAQRAMNHLQNAMISEDDGPSELASTLKELSPQRVEDAIHLMIEADPSMLDRKNFPALRTSAVTAQLGVDLVPLESESPPEAPRD